MALLCVVCDAHEINTHIYVYIYIHDVLFKNFFSRGKKKPEATSVICFFFFFFFFSFFLFFETVGSTWIKYSEPGIHHGNEDSHEKENRKSRNKIFSVGKKVSKHTFFPMNIKRMDQ